MLLSKEFFQWKINEDFNLIFRKAEFALQKVQTQELADKGMIFDRLAVAYGKRYFKFLFRRKVFCWFIQAAGFGFGIISGTFAIVNVLSDMIGPGSIGIRGHSPDFFIATGKYSLWFFYV